MPAFDGCFRWDHKAHPHLVARRVVFWSSCLSRLQAMVKATDDSDGKVAVPRKFAAADYLRKHWGGNWGYSAYQG